MIRIEILIDKALLTRSLALGLSYITVSVGWSLWYVGFHVLLVNWALNVDMVMFKCLQTTAAALCSLVYINMLFVCQFSKVI